MSYESKVLGIGIIAITMFALLEFVTICDYEKELEGYRTELETEKRKHQEYVLMNDKAGQILELQDQIDAYTEWMYRLMENAKSDFPELVRSEERIKSDRERFWKDFRRFGNND